MTLPELAARFPEYRAEYSTHTTTFPPTVHCKNEVNRTEHTLTLKGGKPWQAIEITETVVTGARYQPSMKFYATRVPMYYTNVRELEDLIPILSLWLREEWPGLDTDLSFLDRYGKAEITSKDGIRIATLPFRGDLHDLQIQAGQDPSSPYILFYQGMDHEHYDSAEAICARLDGLFSSRIALLYGEWLCRRCEAIAIDKELGKPIYKKESRIALRFFDPTLDCDLIRAEDGTFCRASAET